MNVFVLGATGYIGSAIASQLRAAGHRVVGLARSESSAEALRARGDEAVIGDLLDLEVLRRAASQAEAVIDTAMAKDWELTTEVLTAAVTTMVDALPEGAPLILTTGAGLYGAASGGLVTEETPRSPLPMLAHLPAVEDVVLGAQRIRGIVVRPTMVYGNGGSIAVTSQLEQIRQAGAALYLDGGEQLVSTAHVEDLARLYVLALEAPAGMALNGTDRPPVSRRELAEALAVIAGMSNERALELLGWETEQIGLLEDLTTGSYRTT